MYIDKSKLECNVIPEGKKFLAYVGIGKGTDLKRGRFSNFFIKKRLRFML